MTLRAPVFVLISAFLLGGCAVYGTGQRPDLPESLGGKGLVIAEVEGVGRFLSYLQVNINGSARGAMSLHHFAIALPPGDYTLDSLLESRVVDTYYTGFVRAGPISTPGMFFTTVETTTFAINRKFSIRAGQITNLGQLVLVFDPQDEKALTVREVDNSGDLAFFLQTYYPKLYGSLKPGAINLAPGSYARGEDLQKLRRQIASGLATRSRNSRYAAGAAGTLALVDREAGGKVRGISLIETGTTAGIVRGSEQRSSERFAYATSDGRFFVARPGRTEQRPALPVESGGYLYAVGERQVLIVRKGLELYASNDDGRTWTHHLPLDAVENEVSAAGYGVADGLEGYYVYQTKPARMVFSSHENPSYQIVSLPDVPNINRLTLRGSDIFLESWRGYAVANEPDFFVRARAGGDWRKRSMPNARCDPIEFLDDGGKKLRTRCSRGLETYESDDGGVKWLKR